MANNNENIVGAGQDTAHRAPKTEGIIGIDNARAYLNFQSEHFFSDTTFTKYINEKLAGDFAFEIANLIHSLYDRNIDSYKKGFHDCDYIKTLPCDECNDPDFYNSQYLYCPYCGRKFR